MNRVKWSVAVLHFQASHYSKGCIQGLFFCLVLSDSARFGLFKQEHDLITFRKMIQNECRELPGIRCELSKEEKRRTSLNGMGIKIAAASQQHS